MRNVLLLTLEYPPMLGGVSEYLGGIFGSLPKGKVHVLQGKGLCFKKRMPLQWFPSIWKTWSAAKKYRSELLVISHVLPMGYVAYLMKRFLKLPYLVIVHGMDLKMAQRSRRKRRWAGMILKNAETVVANSNYTRSIALEFGVKDENVQVIYPCASQSTQRESSGEDVEALRRKYGLEGKKVILSVGRLVKRKGFDDVISALPQLKKFCRGAVYVIVGAGLEEEHLKQLAKEKGVEDQVVFTGSVKREMLPAHFMLGDVFVTVAKELPGDVEGFGIVYLEAGRYGLPVVAGRTGGVPEAVLNGKTGILVNPGVEDELVGAICSIMSSREEAERMGKNGRERAMHELSCERQLEAMKVLL